MSRYPPRICAKMPGMPRVQITARIPDGMVAALKEQADTEGRTFSQALERVLASVLTERGEDSERDFRSAAPAVDRETGSRVPIQQRPPRSVSTKQFKPDFKGG